MAALLAQEHDVLIVEEGPCESRLLPCSRRQRPARLHRDAAPSLVVGPDQSDRSERAADAAAGRLVGGGPAVNNAIHIEMEEGRWSAWSREGTFLSWEDLRH